VVKETLEESRKFKNDWRRLSTFAVIIFDEH